ncbi:MAG: nucleotide exchange factor GrpE [Candidatus Moranbacteria bacterium CG06_land_8_20_14_3_00_43_56]|nr:MAG: nucleotide exchange factor GrpE [Candidatus Moranbacteria bacterium CG06_land_8_20_14_3_00_43_56]PIV84153.1 MAG: nucleotide exchange factor GrpE [Candidatus Moranbacteria bacterium CG17_big_fil_post_rev_8_21_14_2_50_44_12]PIW92907.1 MAG: nucleotide exchange factor GrpE [Candidatus Moranbacteria bacterium CG_4_8_14_3_um_filter_43_15]PJA86412.1 MAG: nucleotide exchange factor GrpE [Candidatus Moranbacteria bacterium CG_4_9_14_3_um_filter_44_28]
MKKEEKKYPEPIVGALIVNKEGKVLLARGKKWGGKYTCFGGHVELGESLEDAIKREVKEEAGLDVEVIDKLLFQDSVFEKDFHKKKHFVFTDFLCKYGGNNSSVRTNKEYENEFDWYTINEALKLDLAFGTRNIIESYIKYLETKKYLDSWKRCQADFENYKKDQAKAREEFAKFAKMDMILQILPVLDNFEASLSHVPEDQSKSAWVAGITHIKRQIEDVLKNNEVLEIEVKVGDKFNPEIHEAISGKGEKVKKVLQKGYRLNGRILRAARVDIE